MHTHHKKKNPDGLEFYVNNKNSIVKNKVHGSCDYQQSALKLAQKNYKTER